MTREDNIFVGGFITGAAVVLIFYMLKKYLWSRSSKVEDAPEPFEPTSEYVLLLAVRNDIPLVKSKLSTHCSHASVIAFDALLKKNPQAARYWQSTGQNKVLIAADSMLLINALSELAKDLNMISTFVCDVQPSLVGPSPVTVLGIGPAPQDIINQITRHFVTL